MNHRHTHRTDASRMALVAMDLQRDFLDHDQGRLPIPNEHGNRVLATANRAFHVAARSDIPVVLVTSHFPASDRRRGARLVHEGWFIEAVQASLHRSSVDGE